MRKIGRYALFAIIGIVVIAGLAFGISRLPKEPAQVHWHAKYRIYVNDRLVNLANPRFDGMHYNDAHLHSPDFDTIHNEGREGRGTMGAFFSYQLGGKLADDELVLPAGAVPAGDFKVNETNKLVMLISNQAEGKDWTPVTKDLAGVNFHDGDRILIVYGDDTPDRIAQLEAGFPDFDPTKQGKTMPSATPT